MSTSKTKEPLWTMDEVAILLNFYLKNGALNAKHPEVKALSELFRSLPIHPERLTSQVFRNPNGISLQLANLLAIDPRNKKKGMRRGSKLAQLMWARWAHQPKELAKYVATITNELQTAHPAFLTPEFDEEQVTEGALLYRIHRTRERNRSIINKKIKQVQDAGLPLSCEVCTFIFEERYGKIGRGYIEVHHRRPLHDSGPTITKLVDLALICSNCHRMIHRSKQWLRVEDLRAIVKSND